MNTINELFDNQILGVTLVSWAVAQILKFIINLIQNKDIDFNRLVGSGGMPSSHSSLVMGLSTAVGIKLGFNSLEYAMALSFAVIVMYDASGVRRAVGVQANLLNEIINDLKLFQHIEQRKLKELIGHTPFQVISGALLGIMIAKMMM
ncbi:MAG: divergent PAP2 family protein [Peptostreptococcales bacterium]